MLTTATRDPVVSIADAMRHGDPDAIADELRAQGVDVSGPNTYVQTVATALDALPDLLRRHAADEPARAHSIALLAASLPPAVRAEYSAPLRAVASLFSEEILAELYVSPSPHARAGARLLSELLAGNPLPVGEEPPPAHAKIAAEPVPEPMREPVRCESTDADLEAIAGRRPVESVALLWTSLPSSAASVQAEILRLLRDIDEPALRALARFGVRSADAGQRVVALAALGELVDEDSGPVLAAAGDPSPDVRLAALHALERRGGRDGIDAASGRVLDPRPDIREAAVAVLQTTIDSRAVAALMTASADPVESVRWRAREAITSMASAEIVDMITPALRFAETEEVAFELLVAIGEPATDSVIEAIDGADARVRGRIGEILRSTGGARRVRALLGDPDTVRRRRAVEAIAAIGGREVIPTLLGVLQDPERSVRVRGVELLAELGDAGVADELALVSLSEPDPFVRAAIGQAIGQLTQASPAASVPEEPNG